MRKLGILSLFLLCSCQSPADAFSLNVRRENDSLLARISTPKRVCIVTYKVYYSRFGFRRVYSTRPGIDIRGECEIDVPAGNSEAKFSIGDDSFRRTAADKKLCVDITYYIGSDNTSLKHRSVCE